MKFREPDLKPYAEVWQEKWAPIHYSPHPSERKKKMIEKFKWVWVDYGYDVNFEGQNARLEESHCTITPDLTVVIEERLDGSFTVEARSDHLNAICWKQLPKSVKQLSQVKRMAPKIIKEGIAKVLKKETTKYQAMLDILTNSTRK
jgi:hypothetical protein